MGRVSARSCTDLFIAWSFVRRGSQPAPSTRRPADVTPMMYRGRHRGLPRPHLSTHGRSTVHLLLPQLLPAAAGIAATASTAVARTVRAGMSSRAGEDALLELVPLHAQLVERAHAQV